MSGRREVFISVDVETSGPIPGEYSLLTIGACLVEDDQQAFACRLKPINRNFVPEAMETTGLSLSELECDGLPPEDAMNRFRVWIQDVSGSDSISVFVGLNAPFDWSFINYYFHKHLGENPFGFTALDLKALYMGATGCGWYDTRSSQMDRTLKPRQSANHDALQDARYQAELFRLIRAGRPAI
ncbi:3'-5' exonuclease [Microvirga sp. ACRRW]|uniref:3'-5' exonuclease n=1 Tax=Microvirga sp. ACRRW TaxID=2918205 RepID=UPI001EF48325|nr:3'-5' exonuclease [Microvirga sp. ACRRW]MCG7394233.1 3'-5' exonuclease [Microvirga sp. ACRRW]